MNLPCKDLHDCSRDTIRAIKAFPENRPQAPSAEQEPQIPHPRLYADLSLISNSPSQLPTVADCAVHLEFLECVYALQQRVLNSNALDRTFGIEHHRTTIWTRPYIGRRTAKRARDPYMEPTFQSQRQEKWRFFVKAAAVRFESWWRGIRHLLSRERMSSRVVLQITDSSLPPLDVLMIWHALCLDSVAYAERCQLSGIVDSPFPWTSIHRAIDSRFRTFTLNADAAKAFTIMTRYEPDLFGLLASENLAKSFDFEPSTLPNSKGRRNGDLNRLFEHLSPPSSERSTQRAATVASLVAAFDNQTTFTQKMAFHYIWLRSPAVEYTVTNAIRRYGKFLTLSRLHPTTKLTPAIDIDLIWRTHILSPGSYQASTSSLCGRVLEYESNGDEDVGNIETTKRLWDKREVSEYSICLCWDCQELGSALEKVKSSDESGQDDVERILEQVKDDVAFYRAVEIARRKGAEQRLPMRSKDSIM